MVTIHSTYTHEVYKNLKYRPTWLPGTPMRLGTVGPIEDGIFRPVTDLARLDIRFEETVDAVPDGTMDFSSETGVSIEFKAAGELNQRFKVIAAANAGALVEFSRERAVVLQLKGVSLNRISDQPALNRGLLRAIAVGDESKRWLRDWVVVTDIAQASSATILITGSSAARLELKASGSVAPESLADASAKFSVAAESQVSTRLIAESGLTPLYRAVRVKRGFWSLYDEVLPASATAPEPNEVFGEADPSEDVDESE
jgi:hypothetical protein